MAVINNCSTQQLQHSSQAPALNGYHSQPAGHLIAAAAAASNSCYTLLTSSTTRTAWQQRQPLLLPSCQLFRTPSHPAKPCHMSQHIYNPGSCPHNRWPHICCQTQQPHTVCKCAMREGHYHPVCPSPTDTPVKALASPGQPPAAAAVAVGSKGVEGADAMAASGAVTVAVVLPTGPCTPTRHGAERAKHKAMTPGKGATQLHANMRHTCLLVGHDPGSITTSLVTPHPPLAPPYPPKYYLHGGTPSRQ